MLRATLALLLSVAIAACGGATATPAAPATATAFATGPASITALTPVGPTERAAVIRIVDGDTIVIDRGRGDERVRFIGMNTPETQKPNTPVESMGREASAANAALVEGHEVLLETDVSDTDQYGRLLRYVWVDDPERSGDLLMVNLALVASGYAQAVSYPPDVRFQDDLRAAELAAREQGLGLWARPTPAP
jgi:endonuclease YncB( thermonuclease family)